MFYNFSFIWWHKRHQLSFIWNVCIFIQWKSKLFRLHCFFCTTWSVASANISALFLYTVLLEQDIALILKQFCLQILLMQFLLQRVLQTPQQRCTAFYTYCTQWNIIGCMKTCMKRSYSLLYWQILFPLFFFFNNHLNFLSLIYGT